MALAIGLAFSWIVVRTDTPCKGFIAAVSMIPLFVPPLLLVVPPLFEPPLPVVEPPLFEYSKNSPPN